jgi:GNAT superfamily N-acetyltransferase
MEEPLRCTVRTMRPGELDFAIEQAAREGWNPGLHDARAFHAADPGGFLLAEQGGAPVGCISAVSYAGGFGFIGLFIVAPPWRGRGIGRQLWDQAMARLAGRDHVVGLDGVPAQQDYYRRNGFALAWQNVRHAGVAPAAAGRMPAQVVPLREVDFSQLCADDRRVFPAPREAFLRAWTGLPDATGLAWQEQGRLGGWGLIRRCRQGHKIGPLVADDPSIATALYAALCGHVPAGDAVFLDVPQPNAHAMALAQARGMRSVFHTARMYAGPVPGVELQRVYGITSFELG